MALRDWDPREWVNFVQKPILRQQLAKASAAEHGRPMAQRPLDISEYADCYL